MIGGHVNKFIGFTALGTQFLCLHLLLGSLRGRAAILLTF